MKNPILKGNYSSLNFILITTGSGLLFKNEDKLKNPVMQEHYSPASPDFIYTIFYSYRLIYCHTLIKLYENIQK